jgi:hypothetical protein
MGKLDLDTTAIGMPRVIDAQDMAAMRGTGTLARPQMKLAVHAKMKMMILIAASLGEPRLTRMCILGLPVLTISDLVNGVGAVAPSSHQSTSLLLRIALNILMDVLK